MKLFCKHDYRMIIAKKNLEIKEQFGSLVGRGKVGVKIYCSKCGKIKKRLGKKIAYFVAKEESIKMQEQFGDVITRYFIEEADNEQNRNTTKNR